MLAHVHFHLLISVFIYSYSSIAIAIFSTMLTKKNSLEQTNKLDLLNKTPNAFSNMQMAWLVEKVVHPYELSGTNPRFFLLKVCNRCRSAQTKVLEYACMHCLCYVLSSGHLLETLSAISSILGESVQSSLASVICALITCWLSNSTCHEIFKRV